MIRNNIKIGEFPGVWGSRKLTNEKQN